MPAFHRNGPPHGIALRGYPVCHLLVSQDMALHFTFKNYSYAPYTGLRMSTPAAASSLSTQRPTTDRLQPVAAHWWTLAPMPHGKKATLPAGWLVTAQAPARRSLHQGRSLLRRRLLRVCIRRAASGSLIWDGTHCCWGLPAGVKIHCIFCSFGVCSAILLTHV
jgi:hypothetical protein